MESIDERITAAVEAALARGVSVRRIVNEINLRDKNGHIRTFCVAGCGTEMNAETTLHIPIELEPWETAGEEPCRNYGLYCAVCAIAPN
jgi:hypothetical protein